MIGGFFSAKQIRAIDRKQEVPHDGPMCDLLWSDPDGADARAILVILMSHVTLQI